MRIFTVLFFLVIQSSHAFTGPKEFLPLVNDFVAEGFTQGRSAQALDHSRLTMAFGTTEGNVIGLCYSGQGYKPSIVISRRFWDESSDTARKLVLHHELGHCVLDRRHREGRFTNGNPMSMMYPIILADQTYLAYQDYYEREMYELQTSMADEGDSSCEFTQ